jgi:hypothetical protein
MENINLHFTKCEVKFKISEQNIMQYLNENDINKIRTIASSIDPENENVDIKLFLMNNETNNDHTQFDLYIRVPGNLTKFHIKDLQLETIDIQ